MGLKKAFTLAELMVVFAIIGTIIALGVSSVKPWEKSYKYAYHRIYNSLALSIYNHMVNTSDDIAFPQTAEGFCNALLEYMNTAGENKDSKGNAYCTGNTLGDNPKDEDFIKENVRIRPTNGTRLWIGAPLASKTSAPYSVNFTQGSLTQTVKYYIVYADLNGDRKPNTAVWTRNRMADIVAFIVTDKYAVIPIGYPEVDARYLEANVVYPSHDSSGEEETSESEDYETSDAITYYEAKVQAFDLDDNGSVDTVINNIYTYDFSDKFNNNSPFKVKHKDGSYKTGSNKSKNYSSHYETEPKFDDHCISAGNSEPVCSIRINDLH